MKFFGEFKKFISRGNVMDMAIGVVMGTAFTKIVNSLVTNIITPAISLLTGKVNVATLAYKVNEGKPNEISIAYGDFIQAIIDFVLVAFSIFCVIKIINTVKERLQKAEETEEAVEEAKPTEEVLLLTEIRDLLKK